MEVNSELKNQDIAPATVAAIEEIYVNQESFRHTRKRAGILRVFPVIFVVLLIIFIYTIFVAFHLVPLLQFDVDSDERNKTMAERGIAEAVVFHILFVMFVITYILSIITPPGTIPDTKEWNNRGIEETAAYNILETKREGQRRHCKWCKKYKPDRSHHCRQCRRCVLKMDHHCPWIYNCVGWGNHKYFILTLIYSSLTTLFVVGAQVESVKAAIDEPQIRFGIFILLLFSEALSVLLALICTCFLGFHFWLIVHNLSTIEFCEKQFRRGPGQNIYNRGCCKNLGDVFGHNPLLWLLPIDNRPGDGVHFRIDQEAVTLLQRGLSSRQHRQGSTDRSRNEKIHEPSGHPII